MGGGTTIVEGARLGMEMYGTDLNPVAWFVVRNELAEVERSEVEALLAAVEAEVRPAIMPFYACDCPHGHTGTWTRRATGEAMGPEFDPLALRPEQRAEYDYAGPEAIYVFWAKHGPCQVTGCGHRTPIISAPVMAVKTLTVNAWAHRCRACRRPFEVEEQDARMAPGAPLVAAASEAAYAVRQADFSVRCPHCAACERVVSPDRKPRCKKVELALLIHPQWLAGEAGAGGGRRPLRRLGGRRRRVHGPVERRPRRAPAAARGARPAAGGGDLPGDRPALQDRQGGRHGPGEVALRVRRLRHGAGRVDRDQGVRRHRPGRRLRSAGVLPHVRPGAAPPTAGGSSPRSTIHAASTPRRASGNGARSGTLRLGGRARRSRMAS